MEQGGKNKKVYLFLQVEGKLEEFKVPTEGRPWIQYYYCTTAPDGKDIGLCISTY